MAYDDKEQEERAARRERNADKVKIYAAKGVTGAADTVGKLPTKEALPFFLKDGTKDQLVKVGEKLPKGMATTLRRTAAGGNIAIDVADGVSQVANEKEGYRGARAAGVVLEKGATIAPAAMVATGAAAAPVGGVALGMLVVPAAAAYFIHKDTDLVIDAMKAYDEVDGKFKPDPQGLSNLSGIIARNKKELKAEGVTFDKQGHVDLSVGKNRAIIQRMVNEIREESEKKVDATHRKWRPRPMQTSDNEVARMDEREAESALIELDIVRKAIAKAEKAQEHGHGHGGVPNASKGRGGKQTQVPH